MNVNITFNINMMKGDDPIESGNSGFSIRNSNINSYKERNSIKELSPNNNETSFDKMNNSNKKNNKLNKNVENIENNIDDQLSESNTDKDKSNIVLHNKSIRNIKLYKEENIHKQKLYDIENNISIYKRTNK